MIRKVVFYSRSIWKALIKDKLEWNENSAICCHLLLTLNALLLKGCIPLLLPAVDTNVEKIESYELGLKLITVKQFLLM